MGTKIYDPLSDMYRIKDSLASLFCDTEDITNLVMPNLDDPDFTFEENWYGGRFEKTVTGKTKIADLLGHCFTTPYIDGTVSDSRCAIFIDTLLISVSNKFIKEVGVEVSVVCHKSSVRLSKNDKTYYESIGVYGNRVDCLSQLINSSILSENIMKAIMKKYSIGSMNLVPRTPVRPYIPGNEFYGKILNYTYQSTYQKAGG